MSKIMPHNLETEQAILAIIILYPNEVMRVTDQLKQDDFYHPRHQVIFQAISNIHYNRQAIDTTILSSYLKEKELLVQAGGLEYLVELTEGIYSRKNLDSYIEIVKNKSLLRKLISTASDIVNDSYDSDKNIEDLLEESEKKMLDISRLYDSGSFKRLSSVVGKVVDDLQHKADLSKEGLTGLRTGYTGIDKLTLGLQKDDLIILAARPAMGKTAFALDLGRRIATDLYNKNAIVAMFSLEMSVEQLSLRLLASEAMIESHSLKKMSLNHIEKSKLIAAKDSLSKLNIFLDDSPGIKVGDIKAKCRKLKNEHGLDLVLIDYLQLITGNGGKNSNRQLEVSEISRSLKSLARELKIPVIALSQLSRQVESREDKRPMMSDLRESGSIEQDADIVAFLYRDDYYNKNSESQGMVEVIFSKHRHGETGTIKLGFKREYGTFINMATNYNEEPINSDNDDI